MQRQLAEVQAKLADATTTMATAAIQREAAVKETAEYRGQLQLLKSQNAELIAKLAERGDGPKKSK